MRLSEAMRLGSMLKPQAIGVDSAYVEYPRVPGDVLGLRAYRSTCAFMAALDAHPITYKPCVGDVISLRGEPTRYGYVMDVPDSWAHVLVREHDCPVHWEIDGEVFRCGINDHGLTLIAHLNDDHRWTREQIASWVATIEATHAVVDELRGVLESQLLQQRDN